ncbi:MAG: co-chaperone GroES [Patescibacteria group bacterium]
MKKAKSKKQPKKKAAVKKVKAVTKKGIGMPYGDRVLVKPEPTEETTSFGIISPDTSKEKPEQGVVVAVGEGRTATDGTLIPVRVKKGDKIMFSKYGYDEVKINGADYYLIREDSITYIF